MGKTMGKQCKDIVEEFANQVITEARKCRATEVLKHGGNVYAFDTTTI